MVIIVVGLHNTQAAQRAQVKVNLHDPSEPRELRPATCYLRVTLPLATTTVWHELLSGVTTQGGFMQAAHPDQARRSRRHALEKYCYQETPPMLFSDHFHHESHEERNSDVINSKARF
ncbi:hypothetical protein E2C01_014017 [Portunus trituberculatus]|uniref:Uncharacterized protein n=1 Tax=Portunus trituberculatus TaxID=210409 RepID=A0A5B7DIT8_PORTR|nr:hypothetical protein [Portunus trituberculatus]